jgi:hypothetical protein
VFVTSIAGDSIQEALSFFFDVNSSELEIKISHVQITLPDCYQLLKLALNHLRAQRWLIRMSQDKLIY